MQANSITAYSIVFALSKTKQRTKILAEMTNERAAKNKQTKFSHYLEVVQNSRFCWVLKKLSL